MKSSFEDPDVLNAMCDLVNAVSALESAADDRQTMEAASAKSLAILTLRKRLEEQGWLAPARLRVGGPG